MRAQRLFFHCAQGFLDLAFELVIGRVAVPEQFAIHSDAMAALQAAEKTAAYEIFALDKDALRILDMNAKIAAKEAEAIPLPKEETTPPVVKMYLVMLCPIKVLCGFDGRTF